MATEKTSQSLGDPEPEGDNTTPEEPFAEASLFGFAATCRTLEDVEALIGEVVGDDASAALAAYGMLLSAHGVTSGPYRMDAMRVLDCLVRAKATIDIAGTHHPTVFETTAAILESAQRFNYHATVPCTEWPKVEEIVEVVRAASSKYAKTDGWEVLVHRADGAVIGSRKVGGGETGAK